MTLLRLILGFLLALALGGCGPKAARTVTRPTGPVKVTVHLGKEARAESAGVYQAVARGHYRRAGLEVEIAVAEGENIGEVLAGRAEFGVARSDEILLRASEGAPLQMVAASRQHDTLVLFVRSGSPVRRAADLKGRVLLVSGDPVWAKLLQKRDRLTFTMKKPAAGFADFLAAEDAIQAGYLTSDLVEMRRRGELRTIELSDAAFDPCDAIFCRTDFTRQNPEVVRSFVEATVQGWRDFLEGDPDMAFQLMLERNRTLDRASLEFARGEFILGRSVTGDPLLGEAAGALSFDRLGRQVDLLMETGVMAAPVALSAVASKDFVPPPGP